MLSAGPWTLRPLLISPALLHVLLLVMVHWVLLMLRVRTGSVISISCHWLKQASWVEWSHEAGEYILSSVEGLGQVHSGRAKGMDAGRAKGLGLITHSAIPGSIQIYMILCFSYSWFFFVFSLTDFKLVDIVTLLLSDC